MLNEELWSREVLECKMFNFDFKVHRKESLENSKYIFFNLSDSNSVQPSGNDIKYTICTCRTRF